MAYYQNDFIKYNYPNQYYQNPMQNNQMNQQYQANNNGIIWVQGESGAKSYLVAPNSTVQLWDSESHTIYLKSADASGMPSIKILDYTIRNSQDNNQMQQNQEKNENVIDYESQIQELNNKIQKLQEDIQSIKSEFKNKSKQNQGKQKGGRLINE